MRQEEEIALLKNQILNLKNEGKKFTAIYQKFQFQLQQLKIEHESTLRFLLKSIN